MQKNINIDQPANYFFLLRQNIALDGDLLLARLELESFHFKLKPVVDISTAAHEMLPILSTKDCIEFSHHARSNGIQAYTSSGHLSLLSLLIRRLSFIQRIICITKKSPYTGFLLEEIIDQSGQVFSKQLTHDSLVIHAIPHYTLFELSNTIVNHTKTPIETRKNLDLMLDELTEWPFSGTNLTQTALSARSSTSHLGHDLHYYKAKFFPRLARSILNMCTQQTASGADCRIIDNFVGSGTTLVEASLLGFVSFGLDIDPLSVLITRAKLDLLQLSNSQLIDDLYVAIYTLEKYVSGRTQPEALSCRSPQIALPSWLLKNRNMTREKEIELCSEISAARSIIRHNDKNTSALFKVILSDAISRRIRMRFLGTGSGRFSLTFSRNTIPQILIKSLNKTIKVIAAIRWMQENLKIIPAPASVERGDARILPDTTDKFDVLLTSPPYLPASSGRESYAKARAPSLIALDMIEPHKLDLLVNQAIGSMTEMAHHHELLTDNEQSLVDWLQGDNLRRIKADPTARYFIDMRRSFEQMRKFLKPGAVVALVSGKQSTFYKFSTRKILYIAHSATLLAEEAQRSGFLVEAMHDIQLLKTNKNARPRSLDDYYETILMLRNPD